MIDVVALFNENGVPYRDHGKNVARGHVVITCPFCFDDPSMHMGVDTMSGAWGCWRDTRHRGRSLWYLVKAVLGLSTRDAQSLTTGHKEMLTIDQLRANFDRPPVITKVLRNYEKSTVPVDRYKRFFNYLTSRGFDDVHGLCRRFHIRAAVSGDLRERVIFPFHSEGAVIGWQGRAIGKSTLRYISHPPEAIKKCIFNDREQSGDVLFITEGPIDAMKVDWYSSDAVSAIALAGVAVASKAGQINSVCRRFKKVVIMFDQGAMSMAFEVQRRILRHTHVTEFEGTDDLGGCSRAEIQQIVEEHHHDTYQ